jgi:hypothetical protein
MALSEYRPRLSREDSKYRARSAPEVSAVLDEELLLCFQTTDGESERVFAAVA